MAPLNEPGEKRKRIDTAGTKSSDASTLKKKKTVAAAGMKGTLLKNGKDLQDKDDPPVQRRTLKPLPRRQKSPATTTAREKFTDDNVSPVDSDDDLEEAPYTKRRRTSQPVDDGEIIDLTNDAAHPKKRTDAEVLVERMRTWTSSVYGFFAQPVVEYVEADGKRRLAHTFKCLSCKNTIRRFQDTGDKNSNSGLRKHANKCFGKDVVDDAASREVDASTLRTRIMEQPKSKLRSMNIGKMFHNQQKAGVTTYSSTPHTATQTRAECVRWCAEAGRPFRIVSDRGFLSLVKTGRPHHWIPHPTTVSRDTKKAFAKTRKRIAKMLQEYEGDIHFATDAWTSANHRAFVAVTAHLLVDEKPKSILLDFFEVPESHTGETFARELARIFLEFGIESKLGKGTADNALNNDTMTAAMGADTSIPSFTGERDRIRCFAHTINLVAKSFLRLFDPAPKKKGQAVDADLAEDLREALERIADGEDVELTEEEAAALAATLEEIGAEELARENKKKKSDDAEADTDDDVDGLVDARDHLEDVAEAESLDSEVSSVRRALTKIRSLAFKIVNSSTQLLPSWQTTLQRLALPLLLIPRDVRTRWNSTYDMLEFALAHREAIDAFTGDQKNKVRHFELTDDDWDILRSICKVLKVLKHATTYFSSESCLLADVIPAMDRIDEMLTTQLIGSDNDIVLCDKVKTAILLARRTLNKYYTRTDDTDTYRIVMVLDPNKKLEYFRHADWPTDWIDAAQAATRSVFKSEYQNRADLKGIENDLGKGQSVTGSNEGKKETNMFASSRSTFTPTAFDELERYLSTAPEYVGNVVQWWIDNRRSFPCLSRMALDYHTIPATSVAVERVFSRARRIVNWERNRLSAQTTRALMCLGAWSNMGFIHDEDLEVIARSGQVKPPASEEDLSDIEMDVGFDSIVISSDEDGDEA